MLKKAFFVFVLVLCIAVTQLSTRDIQNHLPETGTLEPMVIPTTVATATVSRYQEIIVPQDMGIPEELRDVPGFVYYGEETFQEGLYIDPQFTGHWIESGAPGTDGWGIFKYIDTNSHEYILRWTQYIGDVETVYYEFRAKEFVCYMSTGHEFMFSIVPTEEEDIFLYKIGDCRVGAQL